MAEFSDTPSYQINRNDSSQKMFNLSQATDNLSFLDIKYESTVL